MKTSLACVHHRPYVRLLNNHIQNPIDFKMMEPEVLKCLKQKLFPGFGLSFLQLSTETFDGFHRAHTQIHKGTFESVCSGLTRYLVLPVLQKGWYCYVFKIEVSTWYFPLLLSQPTNQCALESAF